MSDKYLLTIRCNEVFECSRFKIGDIIYQDETDDPFIRLSYLFQLTLKTSTPEAIAFRREPFRGVLKQCFNSGASFIVEVKPIS